MLALKRRALWLLWIGLGASILGIDYAIGPNIAIAYLFLVPVALAAHYSGRPWGLGLAVILPFSQMGFHFAWRGSLSIEDGLVNMVIRILILGGAAYLIDEVRRQAEEIKILRGILPICMHCKKIRTPEQQWQSIEAYITEHSEAQFSHTFCPECGRKYYAEFLEDRDPPGSSSSSSSASHLAD